MPSKLWSRYLVFNYQAHTPEVPIPMTIFRLLDIMARLRDPETGCPWDVKQTFSTIVPYTIEEAYEVADAIEKGDIEGLKDELGDLLLQVVFHARMAEEAGAFAFDDVVRAIADKLVRRHPHVFGDLIADEEGLRRNWEAQKEQERVSRASKRGHSISVLDDVPKALPALTRAEKLQKRAARVGFDWPQATQVLDKIEEEIAELRTEIDGNGAPERLVDETGDLLFALVNLARHLKVDPETALRQANSKFTRRFSLIENALAAEGRAPSQANLGEMDELWEAAKKEEVKGS